MDKKKEPTLSKPHYYGKMADVHVFHATHDDHKALVGIHIENASDDSLNEALQEASTKKIKSVVIHGAPPESLRTKINQTLGAFTPGKLNKSEVGPVLLEKTFLQHDKQTKSDIMAHTNSLETAHKSLMDWGIKKLSSLPRDAVETLHLDNHIIKVRKHDAGQYSGWIESKEGSINHQFERITLPELMTQLQSKLELYGREDEAVNSNEEETGSIQDRLLALRDKLHAHLTDAGLSHDIAEEKAIPKEEKEELGPIKTPAVEEPKGDENGDIKMEIPAKEFIPGMINPEKKCPACENKAEDCVCFEGMTKPRLEFDGKKVTIFFKSEIWDQESREAFADDFKRRAGRLLNKKFS